MFPLTGSQQDWLTSSGARIMRTEITLSANARLDGLTTTINRVLLAGYTGGVMVVLYDRPSYPANILYTTQLYKYGVDGVWIGASTRSDPWLEWIPQAVLYQVQGYAIKHMLSPTQRLHDFFAYTAEGAEALAPLIKALIPKGITGLTSQALGSSPSMQAAETLQAGTPPTALGQLLFGTDEPSFLSEQGLTTASSERIAGLSRGAGEMLQTAGPYSGRAPRGYHRSDSRIFEEVCDRLTAHPLVDASTFEVHVNEGVVTLAGSVDTRHAKQLAEYTAESVAGVKEVNSQLQVTPNPGDMEMQGHGTTNKVQEAP